VSDSAYENLKPYNMVWPLDQRLTSKRDRPHRQECVDAFAEYFAKRLAELARDEPKCLTGHTEIH
jgi:hypothetical protein